ncbi:beta-ketoacyl synthase N-terminal-like domain-containing protein [Streptomyces sp. NPDC058848]|uniref:beta-ketoacyl synthase N-terminal-like domain-containing protein n=1 Tax=unclassified Streptomyces TaxID=2593676 RepID=UPI0036BA46E7
MDHRDILTRFKNGVLGREQAAALLTGAAPAAGDAPLTTAVTESRAAVSQPPSAPALTTAPAGGGLPAPADGYAISAVHGRFPDADGLDAFWRTAMLGGHGAGQEAPVAGERDPDGADERRPGRFLGGVDEFDAVFFGLTPQDAALMDPQERVLLEVVWQTLETAGCTGARLGTLTAADGEPRSVGLYVAHGPVAHTSPAAGPPPVPSAGCCAGLPARLSALLDLRGPGHCVGSGEASFLVALHQALSALRDGECAAALVGAVDLRLDPSRRHAGSGEGVGAVLLRPLAAARAAGDTIHAVVRGTAVAHTGRRAPATADARLARRAMAAAGVEAVDGEAVGVTVRETGATAAAAAGDTGAATGLVALVRAVLQLRHGTPLPAPGGSPAVPWVQPYDESGRELPRRAAVSVRATAGTAAVHVLLEEPPRLRPGQRPAGPAAASEELVLLSAPTPEHLAATARRFADRSLPADGVQDGVPDGARELAALARELRTGRAVMDCRLAVVARDTGELAAALRAFADDPGSAATGDPRRGVRYADLRGAQGPGVLSHGLPETRAYLAALWRGRRLDALARLWLAGADVTAADTAGAVPVLPLPTTAMLRRPLRGVGPPTTDGPKTS